MRAAIYIRMSTDDQTESPERQRSQILPYCKSQGYTIVEEYSDLGQCGWDESRPDFKRLLRDAQDNEFDVIVADELSRISRLRPIDFIGKVFCPLNDAGVVIDTVADGPQDNEDEVIQIILSTVHSDKDYKESLAVSRRVSTGYMKRLLASGSHPNLQIGNPPYGYKRLWNTTQEGKRVGEPKLVIDEELAKFVRLIFDLYAVVHGHSSPERRRSAGLPGGPAMVPGKTGPAGGNFRRAGAP